MGSEKTDIQVLRDQLAASSPTLADFKIIQMCQDYGINYDIPDVNTYRLFAIIASAEQMLLKKSEGNT